MTTKPPQDTPSAPLENPTGVIGFVSSRLGDAEMAATALTFSRIDVDKLNQIERGVIHDEAGRFVSQEPAVLRDELGKSLEAWTVTFSAISKTPFIEANSVHRLLNQVEHHMAIGFYDRLEQWLEHQDNERAMETAREVAREAIPVAWRETLKFLEESARAYQTLQDEARSVAAAFVETHSANLKPTPTPAERADLARRLVEQMLLPDGPNRPAMAKAANQNPILRDAMRTYDEWQTHLEVLSQQAGPTYGPGSDNSSDAAKERDREAARQNAVTHTMTFAFYWPTVFEAWKLERRPTALAHAPAGMVTGSSAPLSLFGHAGEDRKGEAVRRGKGGVIERLVVSRGSARLELRQAQLPLASRVQLGESPTSDEITRGVAQVLGNREVRFFLACFQAAHEDRQAGDTMNEGAFWYWPGRFADMLGLSTSKAARGCDSSLEALMSVSVEATLRAKGKPYKLSARGLVIDGGATLEPMSAPAKGAGRAGRRARRAMMIQDSILGLLRDGGAWFPLTRSMLASPPGVDPRTYDDAFRLLMVLSSYARTNAAKAKQAGLVWNNKVSTVLEASGLVAPSARRHEQIERLSVLLEVLQKGGHLRYDLAGERLRFNLLLMRPALLQVVESTRKRQLGAGDN